MIQLMKVEVPLLSNSECNSLFKLAALEDRVEEDIWVCALLISVCQQQNRYSKGTI